MPTDSAPMVIAMGEAYTGGDKSLPQNAAAARKTYSEMVALADIKPITMGGVTGIPLLKQKN